MRPHEITVLLVVSIGTMLLTSSFLALIIVLIGTVLVMSYLQGEQDLKEQQRQENQLRIQQLEREQKAQEAEVEKQRQAELENQDFILKYGVTQRPEGGFRVATKEEVAAAKKAREDG